jgi:hypothetical protein
MLKLNLLRHFVPGIMGVIGLIFVIVGGWMLVSQSWDKASGTVGQCQTQTTRTDRSSRVEYICDVSWDSGGTSHRTTVNMGRADVAPGETIELRVNGDQAVVATPVWFGAASAAIGAALVALAVVLFRRSRSKG